MPIFLKHIKHHAGVTLGHMADTKLGHSFSLASEPRVPDTPIVEQGKGVVADLWGFCFCVSLFLPPFVQVCFFLPACVLGLCVVWDCLFAIVGVFVCSIVVAYVF